MVDACNSFGDCSVLVRRSDYRVDDGERMDILKKEELRDYLGGLQTNLAAAMEAISNDYYDDEDYDKRVAHGMRMMEREVLRWMVEVIEAI